MHYGITPEAAATAVAEVELTDLRMTVEEHGEYVLLKDFYNAAPDSVRASLTVLKSVKNHRRVAVLGDILEMGEFAETEHKKLGEAAFKNADMLITVGENGRFIAEGAIAAGMQFVVSFDTTESAAEGIQNYTKPGDCILIKASRGMKFEKIYEKYKEI